MPIPIERLERAVTSAAALVTVEVFESFLQCQTKSKLHFQCAAETNLKFKRWLRRERNRYREGSLSWLRTKCQVDEFYIGTPSVEALKQKRWRIIADYVSTSVGICAHLDALELSPPAPNRIASFYRPLRFVLSEKLTGADRLLLAFDALAISQIIGKTPPNGKIIHGCKHRAAVIPLPDDHVSWFPGSSPNEVFPGANALVSGGEAMPPGADLLRPQTVWSHWDEL